MLKRWLPFLLLLILWNCSTIPEHYHDTVSRSALTLEEILHQIENHRVIFTGEIHSDAASHSVQLEVIKHLHNKRGNLVIAIEIFPASQQEVLDAWIKETLSRNAFEREFHRAVNIAFDVYEDIFDFARNMGVPIIGIDADRSFIANVSKNGIKTVPEDYLKEIKFSDCIKNPEYVEKLGFDRNREYHQSGLPYLCDGQRLRDTVMAYNIAKILEDAEATAVVLVGLMHASKIAVPDMLQEHRPIPYKVIMPYAIRQIINRQPDSNIADYVWY